MKTALGIIRFSTVLLAIGLVACEHWALSTTLTTWGGANRFRAVAYTFSTTFTYGCYGTVTTAPLRPGVDGRFSLPIEATSTGAPVAGSYVAGRMSGDTLFAGIYSGAAGDTLPPTTYGLRNQPPGPLNAFCLQ